MNPATILMMYRLDCDPRFACVLADLTNPEVSVRAGAVYTLGQHGGPMAVPLLLRACTDDDVSVREEARYALGELEEELAVRSCSPPVILESAHQQDTSDENTHLSC